MRVKTIVTAVVCLTSVAFGQGSLTPPGAPAPTMKTLDQVEPRIPVSAAGAALSQPGSYYLAANLEPTGSQNGVTISSSDVTLDLNGFTIDGSAASSYGISIGLSCANILVKNGTIRGFYRQAVTASAATDCSYIGLRVAGNSRGSTGYSSLFIGAGSVVENCRIENNNGNGISVGNDSKITGNRIVGNGGTGIKLTGSGNYVADNIVKGNGDNYAFAAGNQLNLLICEIPETLDWPCSVKLAGTLSTAQTGVNGISVNADNVTIDMDGHALVGPGASSGSGIHQASTNKNLTVLNGKAVDWRGNYNAGFYLIGEGNRLSGLQASTNHYGIFVHSGNTIENCTAQGNGFFGIYASSGNRLQNCAAQGNGDDGIYAELGNTLENCAARDNGAYGIYASSGNTLENCAVRDNGSSGIVAGSGNTLENCAARDNGEDGIYASSGNTLENCAARDNGEDGIYAYSGNTLQNCAAQNNTGDGIYCHNDNNILNNACDSNGSSGDGAGIHVGSSDNRIDGNNVTDNDRGIDVDYSGNLIIRNSASGNTTDYDIGAGNDTGTIQTTPVGAGAWDNFEF